jgi:heat shock protein HslJ
MTGRIVLSITVMLAACAPEAASGPPPALAGSAWTVELIAGQAPLMGRGGAPSLTFPTEGGVAGSTGCNRFSGAAAFGAEGALSLGGPDGMLATTRMACTLLLMQQESRMTAALGRVVRYEVPADGRLWLVDADGDIVLEARPAPADASAN